MNYYFYVSTRLLEEIDLHRYCKVCQEQAKKVFSMDLSETIIRS